MFDVGTELVCASVQNQVQNPEGKNKDRAEEVLAQRFPPSAALR